MKRWLEWILLAVLAGAVPVTWSQQAARNVGSEPSARIVESPVTTATIRYDSGGRRDPFLDLVLLRKKAEELDQEVPPGEPLPGIAGTYIAQTRLMGIVWKNGRRMAIFQGSDQRAYFMQESDRLFDGYIKKIEIESVILVRETRLRSGKVTTQEVVKRLRTP